MKSKDGAMRVNAHGLVVDEKGNIIFHPMAGWISAPVAGMSVLLQIQYLQDETTDPRTPERIQFVLKPELALELADQLAKTAARILGQGRPETKGH
jgi:hypothetical protein